MHSVESQIELCVEMCCVVKQGVCMAVRQAASLDQRAVSSSHKTHSCKHIFGEFYRL